MSDLEGQQCFDNEWSKFINFFDAFGNKSNNKVNNVIML